MTLEERVAKLEEKLAALELQLHGRPSKPVNIQISGLKVAHTVKNLTTHDIAGEA